ncbi:MAG TPA: hypothetical protein VF233_12340 [Nitrososphaeraceae archaeon]
MITNYKRGNVRNNTIRNNTTSSSQSLLQIQGSGRSNNNHSNKKIHNYFDNIAINSLEIADGLKELLTKYDFTLNELQSIPTTELAEFLGIDRYIAQIIGGAATKLSNNIDNSNEKLQIENYSTF